MLRCYLLLGICVISVNCNSTAQKSKYSISHPLKLSGINSKVISDLDITGDTSNCISLNQCSNITIQNCRLRNSAKIGINILNCKNIKIINCYFEQVATGVYVFKSQQVNVRQNQFKNMQGPFPRGQMVQFDEVTGAGNKISDNIGENLPGKSLPEDAINLYKTTGTATSPVEVIGNRIRGGGPSKTGGGIMLGDNGGGFSIAKNNILVDPGQYGIAIAGGTHISVINNNIYGRRQPFTNVGIYVWNQHTSACALNVVQGNLVNFKSADGASNPGWNQGNCGKVYGWENNDWNAPINASMLPKQLFAVQ
ncbi:right-handed parallel beta-helix repeat-containing protein [Mucilaginibacter terrenus]|uniref:right-handed parallel beta-helix repeat-containing protein n=1 Tax=Mucilaginibacter terrenus TaxID=2482727 RepID=UPI0029393E26|nr:right-handed parallel beta-helix repeat-containing protein [Mucilaginibacter terrenus]